MDEVRRLEKQLGDLVKLGPSQKAYQSLGTQQPRLTDVRKLPKK